MMAGEPNLELRAGVVETGHRYDLDDYDMSALVEQLVQERPPRSDDRIVCYQLEQGSKYENMARTVEREVFEKFFGNDADEMAIEYGPYESQSIFFLSIDQESSTPAGVLRVIANGPAGLKTLNDLEASDDAQVPRIAQAEVQAVHGIDDMDSCWDVGTVAVRKAYRASRGEAQATSVQLYRALYTSALDNNINHLISIIDQKPYEKMTNFLGIPFVPMLGSDGFPYLGSEKSFAVYGDVRKFYDTMNRKRKTIHGLLARRALTPLVRGTRDRAINL